MSRTTTFILVWAVLATLFVAFNANAHAQRAPHAYPATLLCAHIAEDSAAHVRLVEYGDGRIVYRCQRNGY